MLQLTMLIPFVNSFPTCGLLRLPNFDAQRSACRLLPWFRLLFHLFMDHGQLLVLYKCQVGVRNTFAAAHSQVSGDENRLWLPPCAGPNGGFPINLS